MDENDLSQEKKWYYEQRARMAMGSSMVKTG